MSGFLYQKRPWQFIILLYICSVTIAHGNNQVEKDNILILGDSISAAYGMDINQGWVTLLQQRLLETNYDRYQVINASISGNTSGDGLSRLPQLLKKYTPMIVIIELGGNDGLRGYPVRTLQRNLQQMIDLSNTSGAKVILAGIEIPPNYGERYTALFRKTFQKVADNNQLEFIPFILENIALEPNLMQDDGIHPTAEAQAILLNNVWPTIKKLL